MKQKQSEQNFWVAAGRKKFRDGEDKESLGLRTLDQILATSFKALKKQKIRTLPL